MTAPTNLHHDPDPCEALIALLVRAGDGSLDDAGDRARLDRHLASCAACREALEAQQAAHVALATSFDVEPPPGFAARVAAQVQAPASWFDRFDFRQWTWRAGPVAAGLALAAWLIVASSETTIASTGGDLVSAADAAVAAEAVLWSDAMDEADLVSLAWDDTVQPDTTGGDEAGAQ